VKVGYTSVTHLLEHTLSVSKVSELLRVSAHSLRMNKTSSGEYFGPVNHKKQTQSWGDIKKMT